MPYGDKNVLSYLCIRKIKNMIVCCMKEVINWQKSPFYWLVWKFMENSQVRKKNLRIQLQNLAVLLLHGAPPKWRIWLPSIGSGGRVAGKGTGGRERERWRSTLLVYFDTCVDIFFKVSHYWCKMSLWCVDPIFPDISPEIPSFWLDIDFNGCRLGIMHELWSLVHWTCSATGMLLLWKIMIISTFIFLSVLLVIQLSRVLYLLSLCFSEPGCSDQECRKVGAWKSE